MGKGFHQFKRTQLSSVQGEGIVLVGDFNIRIGVTRTQIPDIILKNMV